jgi:hypothetical protein
MSRVMSVGMYASPEVDQAPVAEERPTEIRTLRPSGSWNPENFAREQIRGLVRQVFFANASSPVRQVVFSAADSETDVRSVCRRVGETLALETVGNVAVAGEYAQVYEAPLKLAHSADGERKSKTLRQTATRLRNNLWLVPFDRGGEESFSNASLNSHLCNLRREFGYSIIEGAPAGMSHETAAMAQLADGIILVLSAHRTRRATARSVKERLEAARVCILGVVLEDRAFPIPERIYQHL